MALPFILAALASLGVGSALGTAQGLGRRREAETDTMRKVIVDAAKSGVELPPSVIGQYFDKKSAPFFAMLAQSTKALRQEQLQQAEQFASGGGPSAGPNLTAPPPPSEMVPGDQPAAPMRLDPMGEAPMPTPTQAAPITLPQPALVAPAPSALQPSPSVTRSARFGDFGVSRTTPGVSPVDIERLNLERQARGEASQKSQREAVLFTQEQEARQRIQTIMQQAATEADPTRKLALHEQALAIATGGGLKEIVATLGSHIGEQRKALTGTKLDLSKPDVAEYVATTGVNPQTGQSVSQAERKQATDFVTAQTTRKREQARVQAETLASITSRELPVRAAATGAVRTLIKEGETVAKVSSSVGRINDAIKVIEDNISAFPERLSGIPFAMTAEFFQTERGRKIKQIQQARTLLQSLEARQLAGEQGRIANQIEQQWREVLADPTKHTAKTARDLLATTKRLSKSLLDANRVIVERNAKAARGAGVPPQLVDAFSQGNLDVLKSTLGEGLNSGALPATITVEDLNINGAKQVD